MFKKKMERKNTKGVKIDVVPIFVFISTLLFILGYNVVKLLLSQDRTEHESRESLFV